MYTKNELNGTTSANFISKLGNYMKLTKICTSDNLSECFPETITDEENDKTYDVDSLKTPKSIGQSYSNDNNVGGIMADGTKFILSYDPNCSITTYSTAITSCMHIVADLPISSNKNIAGEDIYLYNATITNSITAGDLIANQGCSTDSWNINCAVSESLISYLGDLYSSSSNSANRMYCYCDGGCEETDDIVTSCVGMYFPD